MRKSRMGNAQQQLILNTPFYFTRKHTQHCMRLYCCLFWIIIPDTIILMGFDLEGAASGDAWFEVVDTATWSQSILCIFYISFFVFRNLIGYLTRSYQYQVSITLKASSIAIRRAKSSETTTNDFHFSIRVIWFWCSKILNQNILAIEHVKRCSSSCAAAAALWHAYISLTSKSYSTERNWFRLIFGNLT